MADEKYSRNLSTSYGRGAAPAGDPLAELARIIGESDPFAVDPARVRRAAVPPPAETHDRWSGSDPRYHDLADPRDPAAEEETRHPYGQGSGPSTHADPYGDSSYNDARYRDPREGDAYGEPRDTGLRHGGDHQAYQHYDEYYDDRRYENPPDFGGAAHRDPRHEHAYSPDGDYAEERPFAATGRGYEDAGPHQRMGALDRPYGDTPYDDGYARYHAGRDEDEDEEYDEPAPRRRWLLAAMAISAVLVVGAAGAFGYRLIFGGAASGPAPVIRADGGPNKVVPPTQTTDASNKQIYDRISDRGQNERIVPREEQPIEIRDTTRQPAPRGVLAPSSTASIGVPPIASNVTGAFAAASPSPTSAQEPRKIRTVTIRPDQGADIAQRQQARPPAASPPPPLRTGTPARGPGADSPMSLMPEGSAAPAAHAPVRTAAVGPVSAPAVAAAAASGAGWVVQVSAQNSEQEAQAAFRSMQAKYPGQLAGQQPLIRRKDLASGVKYGVQVGPYGSRDEAVRLCEDLKAAGGSCFVAKN